MIGETIRGIDHVGIGVPDMTAATEFLMAAFGAKVIYVALSHDDPPLFGPMVENGTGSAKGTRITAVSVLKIGTGPTLELLEIHADHQAQPARASDLGLNHLSFYSDNTNAAIARFEKAGGTMLSQPIDAVFPVEEGEGNTFCYGRTPWGMSIEFVAYPSHMAYEDNTPLRRWHRGA